MHPVQLAKGCTCCVSAATLVAACASMVCALRCWTPSLQHLSSLWLLISANQHLRFYQLLQQFARVLPELISVRPACFSCCLTVLILWSRPMIACEHGSHTTGSASAAFGSAFLYQHVPTL